LTNNKDEKVNLIDSCKNGNEEEIKKLIDDGADVNMVDENGDTPLTISCEKRDLKIIKYLIEKGAETNISNSTGNSPLNLVCRDESESSLEILDYLIENKKTDINFKDKNGNSALLVASYFRNNKVISKLIKKVEMKVNIQNVYGDTPLIICPYFKNEKIVSELVKKKADMNIKNKYGENYVSVKSNKSKSSKGKKKDNKSNSELKNISEESLVNYNDYSGDDDDYGK